MKNLFAEVNYAYRISTSNAEKLSYNKNFDGKYTALDTLFSTHYIFDVTTNTGGAALKYNGKKITFGAGMDVGVTNFNQEDILRDTILKRDYTNFFPRANFVYKFNQTSRLFLSYNGSTQQPSITQITPVADNTNPLIVTIGNPYLDQEFRHNISFNANSFKVLSQRGFFMYGNVTITDNAIVTNQRTLPGGITTYTYVNTDGNYNAYTGFSYFKKFNKANFNLNAGLNFNGSRYSNFVNGEKNQTNNLAPGFELGFNKQKEKKYNINYWARANYNISTSSINEDLETKYWTQSHNFDITLYFLKKFELNNQVNAELRQKTPIFTNNNNVVVWSAYLGRKFLKNDKGLLKFYVYDILNQNKGFDRMINTNVITERNYETINRYFMLSFVWNFSKTAAGMPAPGQ